MDSSLMILEEAASLRKAADVIENLLARQTEGSEGPADAAYRLGLAAYEARLYHIASEQLSASFALEQSGETAIRIAMCFWRTGEHMLMYKWARIAVGFQPMGVFTTLIIGGQISYLAVASFAEYLLGRIDSACTTAEQALKAYPDDEMALGTVIRCYLALGRISDVLQIKDRIPQDNGELLRLVSAFSVTDSKVSLGVFNIMLGGEKVR